MSLLAYQVSSEGIRTEIPGRCAGTCTTQIERVFFECVEQLDRGCSLQSCDSPSGGATCDVRSGFPDQLFTGEDVSLFDIPVATPFTTQIDLSALPQKVDVYFLVDATGSMGSGISALQDSISDIIDSLLAIGDFAFGLGIYRDERELDMGFMNIQSITTDTSTIETSVDELEATGGRDTPEANLVALYRIATGDFVNWRDSAKRVVLLFGDAVGHEPTCFDDVELTRQVVTDALNEESITVQAVETQSGNLDAPTSQFGCGGGGAPAGQTTFIAEGTGGMLSSLPSETAANVLNTFTSVVTPAIEVAESDCGAGLTFSFDPSLPAVIAPNSVLNTTITVRRRACRLELFRCSISFGCGGSVSDPIRFRISPTGCPS